MHTLLKEASCGLTTVTADLRGLFDVFFEGTLPAGAGPPAPRYAVNMLRWPTQGRCLVVLCARPWELRSVRACLIISHSHVHSRACLLPCNQHRNRLIVRSNTSKAGA